MPDELRDVRKALDRFLSLPNDWHTNPIDYVSSKMFPKKLGQHLYEGQGLNLFPFLFELVNRST